MIYLIIVILCVIWLVILAKKDKFDEAYIVFPIILSVLFLSVFAVILFIGINEYPYLKGEQERVLVLQDNVELMKSAHYSEVISGNLVGGSVDNLKQSTNLSIYINSYISVKSVYNKRLTRIKISKQLPIMWWFDSAAFYSKKILLMKKL